MRVRRFELRILAAVLVAGWALACGLVLLAYRPGGPADLLVGLSLLVPVAIAAAALAWPPVARGGRAFRLILAIGIGAALVLLPSVGGLWEHVARPGPPTLLPSFESAYPWLLALAGTALFSGIGIARRLLGDGTSFRRRIVAGTAIGAALAVVGAVPVAGAAIANDLALRDRPAASSRFGPTDPGLILPACEGAIAAGTTARLTLAMEVTVDGRASGSLAVAGLRTGSDFRWDGPVASAVELGRFGQARIGRAAWIDQGGRWTEVDPRLVENGTLDLQVLATALAPGELAAAESLGIGYVEGARARHCRVAVDGPTFREAFPQMRLLVGDADTSRWRGELDYWIFADGELGQVVGSVNGEGADLVPKGILGTVRTTLTATDRGVPVIVSPPAR
jgi:hypothetical protein